MSPADAATPTAHPLRISYLFSQFPVATEVFAVSDIVALREQGHVVAVHTMKGRPAGEAALSAACGIPTDLPVFRASWSGALRWPLIVWRSRAAAGELVRRILREFRSAPLTASVALLCIPRVLEMAEETRRFGSDVVHVFWSRHAGMALAALRDAKSPAVRTAFVGAYDLVADDLLVGMTLDAAQTIFSHAETNRDFAEARAPAGVPVRIIHRGIPLGAPGNEEERYPDCWITASALVPSKNAEAIIRALAAARASRPALKLKLFGDGPDRQRLAAIAKSLGCEESVEFRGHIPRERLATEMRKAALFILLSKKPSERLPNVVKEALWAGCAVISSRSEGIEELIPDDSIGQVVDPDDAEAVNAAVGQVLGETATEAAERRARARALVEERFSSNRSMERYVGAWRAVIRAGVRAK